MFKLPIRQAVINSDSVVKEVAGSTGEPATISIEGFGTFQTKPSGTVGFKTASSPATLGVYTLAAPSGPFAVGQVWDLTLTFSQGPRTLSEIWSYGEKRTFQSAKLSQADGAGWANAMAAAMSDDVMEYFGKENVLKFTTSGATLIVTFLEGYEGIGIKMGEAILATDSTGVAEKLAVTTTTEPSEGVNLGKQIEAEVHNATFENIDPYGLKTGGNSAVDVRATYTEYHFQSGPSIGGWEPHGNTGYGDVNTQSMQGASEFSLFVNDASVSAGVHATLLKLTQDTPNAA